MLYEDLSNDILDAVYYVHKKLGPGLLEKPYHNALYYHLKKNGLSVGFEVPFIIDFDGDVVGEYYADLVVENKVIIEVKAVQSLHNSIELYSVPVLNTSIN